MKTARILAALLLTACSAFAQSLAVSFDVKNVASSRQQSTSYKDGYGGDVSSYARQRFIEITLRGIGQGSKELDVTTWWIGKAIGSSQKVVLKKNTLKKVITGATPMIWEETSGSIVGKDVDLPLIGYRSTSGAKIEGWVVQIAEPGSKVPTSKASDSYLLDFVRKLPDK